MSKKNNYYLIARCCSNNHFSVVPIHDQRGCSLEEIDLFTMSFRDRSSLEQELLKKGIIKEKDIDFFIASQSRVNEETFLKKQEVVYSRHSTLKEIAKDSINKQITNSENRIDIILDTFARRMQRDYAFRELVVSGKTNVYEKYIKYFNVMFQDMSKTKYRDGSWARTSYPLIRNVVEALGRPLANYNVMSNQMYRGLLDRELIRVTDSEYDPNQLLMPGFFADPENSYDEDKLLEVVSTFECRPTVAISVEGRQAEFNPVIFSSYREGDKERFQTELPQELLTILHAFLMKRDALESVKDGRTSFCQREVQISQTKLIQFLINHPEVLDHAYDWCQLYNAYQDKMLGDVRGKVYRKRENN